MPKVAVFKFLTFFIFAFDALHEPPHLHIVKEKKKRQRSAKIWLTTLAVADRGSLSDKELNQALALIKKNRPALVQSFNDVKQGKKIITLQLM